MPGAESTNVQFPRFTTLIGAFDTSTMYISTLPLDVSRYGPARFKVWHGPVHDTGESPTPGFTLGLEEPLDAENWALGAEAIQGKVLGEGLHFFSYSFRLRWFRLRVPLTGTEPMVTCGVQGILR